MNVSLVYKCRSCGKEFTVRSVQQVEQTRSWLTIFNDIGSLWKKRAVPETAVHTCGRPPNVGIGDLIRFVPDTEVHGLLP